MVTKVTDKVFKQVKDGLAGGKAPSELAKESHIGVSTVHRIGHSKDLKHYQEHYNGSSQEVTKKRLEKKLQKHIDSLTKPKDLGAVRDFLELQISNTRSSIMALADDVIAYSAIAKFSIIISVIALVLAIIK